MIIEEKEYAFMKGRHSYYGRLVANESIEEYRSKRREDS